ncbi:hypothetical protein ACROYT_G002011 [Oculina patagonica]
MERLKRTLDDEAEDPGCNIPGVWSCNSGKREMQTLNAEPELKTVAEPAKLSSAAARGCNIPGVWACSGVTQLSGDDDSATSQLQGATTEGNGNNFDDNQSEDDPDKCPLGNLDCRRKPHHVTAMLVIKVIIVILFASNFGHTFPVDNKKLPSTFEAKECPPGFLPCVSEKDDNVPGQDRGSTPSPASPNTTSTIGTEAPTSTQSSSSNHSAY